MDCRIEQRVERLTRLRFHPIGVLDLVDMDALEERLVADAPE
ncbi:MULTISPECIES: hypothetical protein [Microbacteriaceae]|nr:MULTISPECIES: hypothetical protein [Microbacteriaceae]